MVRSASVRTLWKYGEQILHKAWSETARRDARLLLMWVLGYNAAEFYARLNLPVSSDAAERFGALLEERLTGVPLQYLHGEQEFWGLTLRVGPGVLIPRPETEHLVEHVIDLCKANEAPRIADLGTGSAAIALALAAALPMAEIDAVECDKDALCWAELNLRRYGHLAERIHLISGDMATVLKERYDVLLSNPPYIATGDLAGLPSDVRQEPRSALDGGKDGLDYYRLLVRLAEDHLLSGGHLAAELGAGQSEAVWQIFYRAGFTKLHFGCDLAGIPRVLSGWKAL